MDARMNIYEGGTAQGQGSMRHAVTDRNRDVRQGVAASQG